MLYLTADQIKLAAPSGLSSVIAAIADHSLEVFDRFDINTTNRVLGFMSVTLEETGNLTLLTENLNYTAARAHEVFPSLFPTVASAVKYARNPEAFANKVYGGRMGNKDPGDGWKYRGQGLPQITGRDNFALVQKLTGLPTVDHPEIVTQPEHMLECAVALFVQYPKILSYCDTGDFQKVWALVGTGSPTGRIINISNHENALAAARKMRISSKDLNVEVSKGSIMPTDPVTPPAVPDVVAPSVSTPRVVPTANMPVRIPIGDWVDQLLAHETPEITAMVKAGASAVAATNPIAAMVVGIFGPQIVDQYVPMGIKYVETMASSLNVDVPAGTYMAVVAKIVNENEARFASFMGQELDPLIAAGLAKVGIKV